jgi:hypothetical protein
MNIDIGNPATIIVFIIFGIGTQLWVEWLKRQIEVADNEPEKAKKRIANLKNAGLRTLIRMSYILLGVFCLFMVILSLQRMQNDIWFGVGTLLGTIALMLLIVYQSTGDWTFRQIEKLAFASSFIVIGIGGAIGDAHYLFVYIFVIASGLFNFIVHLRSIILIQKGLRSTKRYELSNKEKGVLNPFTTVFLLILLIGFSMRESIASLFKVPFENFRPIIYLLVICSMTFTVISIIKRSFLYKELSSLLLTLAGMLYFLWFMDNPTDLYIFQYKLPMIDISQIIIAICFVMILIRMNWISGLFMEDMVKKQEKTQ